MMLKILLLLVLAQLCSAFVIPTAAVSACTAASCNGIATAPLLSTPAFLDNSQVVAAATIDPTAILSGIAGGIIGSPIILAVPILAALGVAFVIGWLIFAYATPQVEDDEQ
jgi:hypothetical protein